MTIIKNTLALLIIFVPLLSVFALMAGEAEAHHRKVCHTWIVPEDDSSYFHARYLIRELGWFGKAGDGAERLYSPGCRR